MAPTTCYQHRLFDRAEVKRRFFIQKHDATHLHYDFRLEHEGVLKSWAMPVGPCLDAAASRIAVLVKDHAIEDGYSEGTIPAGRYGAGTIMIWDRGIWLTDQDAARALYAGEMRFRLCGKKLNGIWSLTRMPLKRSHKPENWLSKRAFDEESRSLSDMDVLVERPESVRSGRTLAEIARDPPPFVPARPGTRRGGRPAPNQLALFT